MTTSKQITLGNGVQYQRQDNDIHLTSRRGELVVSVLQDGLLIKMGDLVLAQVVLRGAYWRPVRVGPEVKLYGGPMVMLLGCARNNEDRQIELVSAHYVPEENQTSLVVSTDLKLIAQNNDLVIYRPADEVLGQNHTAESELGMALSVLHDQPDSVVLPDFEPVLPEPQDDDWRDDNDDGDDDDDH